MDFRIGQGYDVHRLTEGRELILGGIKIPYFRGLDGHSDADVLVHAIMDALIGAAAMGDIGKLFPDTDPSYKGVSSLKLLEVVMQKLHSAGYKIVNVDSTVIAQEPKLAPYISQMTENISKILGNIQVNIKATTEENLGFTGERLGISAHAIALLMR